MATDIELLRAYARQGSEAAFTELVRRHLDLVHAAARRQCGAAAQAEDVAQTVFTELARKAPHLCDRDELVGWLFVSTRYAALKLVRGETRRAERERKAAMNDQLHQGDAIPIDWARLQPELDAALAELREKDRAAVLLRVFQGQSFAEVGAALCTTAEGARKQVDRSMEKLRAKLARRGITSTAAALGLALAGNTATAAPAGLAAKVSGIALAGAPSVGFAGTLVSGFQILCDTKTAVVGATVAATLLLGVAVQQTAALHELEALVKAATAEREVQDARLADLRTRVEAVEHAPPLRARANAAGSVGVATVSAERQQRERTIERGAEFLAAHPEAQELLAAEWRAKNKIQLDLLSQKLQLTPEQRIAVEIYLRRTRAQGFQLPDGEHMVLTISKDVWYPQNPQAWMREQDELAAALGEKADRIHPTLSDCRRLANIHQMVNRIAGAAAGAVAPLRPPQAEALMEVLDEGMGRGPAGRWPFSMPEENWQAVRRTAAGILDTPQLEVLDLMRLQIVFADQYLSACATARKEAGNEVQ